MGLVSANAQSNKYDLNEDGNVNITDVIELVNYILGLNNGNPGGGNEINATAEAIDLGLPSGTKWASCNVDAAKPEKYGGYYAWGETSEKKYTIGKPTSIATAHKKHAMTLVKIFVAQNMTWHM